jgi:hypothetical protein
MGRPPRPALEPGRASDVGGGGSGATELGTTLASGGSVVPVEGLVLVPGRAVVAVEGRSRSRSLG